MADSYIEVNDVFFSYNKTDDVLNGLNMNIKKGEYTAVVGHNGSGKSTLAKHLNAILIPNRGEVIVDGISSSEANAMDIRKKVGMVFQNPDNQLVATLVEEDVAFAPENLGIPKDDLKKRVDEALKTVGMYKYKEKSPHNLSGGQKQRVAIAGILAMDPDCIVLDEATSMLDPKGRREILKTIHRLNKNLKKTIVNITHSMDEAALADRIIVMDRGKVVLTGTPREVFKQPKRLEKIGLSAPLTTVLISRLQEEGVVENPDVVLTVDECAEALKKILESKNGCNFS